MISSILTFYFLSLEQYLQNESLKKWDKYLKLIQNFIKYTFVPYWFHELC